VFICGFNLCGSAVSREFSGLALNRSSRQVDEWIARNIFARPASYIACHICAKGRRGGMSDFELVFTYFFAKAFLYLGIAFAVAAGTFAFTRRNDIAR
jgi:hypothetical protein